MTPARFDNNFLFLGDVVEEISRLSRACVLHQASSARRGISYNSMSFSKGIVHHVSDRFDVRESKMMRWNCGSLCCIISPCMACTAVSAIINHRGACFLALCRRSLCANPFSLLSPSILHCPKKGLPCQTTTGKAIKCSLMNLFKGNAVQK